MTTEMRTCSRCQQPKPATNEFFRVVTKKNGIRYMRHLCNTCAQLQGQATWQRSFGTTRVKCPYSLDELLTIRAEISPSPDKLVSWLAVCRHLGINYSLIANTIQQGKESGAIPVSRYVAVNQRNTDVLAIVKRYLNRHNIGTSAMAMQDRLQLMEKRYQEALAPKIDALRALVASRQQNAELRAEIRELKRQLDSLWKVRDSYRQGFELRAGDHATDDEGWSAAGD
jgi:protein-arginine kinase activator protein McsA